MPSKGVQCYSYIAVPGCEIVFSVPGTKLPKTQLRVFSSDHLEVDKKNIKGPFNFSGIFSFRVTQNGNQITFQDVGINVLTGDNDSGSMKTMGNQTSVVTNDVIVTYGFYDAGPGTAGLPSSDQCWFFLPAVHDVGMNSMQNSNAVISSSALVDVLVQLSPVFGKIAGMMSHDAVMAIAPNIVQGLAITQKDTLPTMLSIGARYFEFRPAFLHKVIRPNHPIPDELYFSHSAIPGMAYAQFLHDVVAFLVAHPAEIVVTQLRWDGVPADCARPSDVDLANYLNRALADSHGSVVAGNEDDMRNLTIDQLREQRKRLILFANSDSFSTYTDPGNATLNGDSIIAEFEKISPQSQAGKPFTNLQCQATATNIRDAVVYSVLAAGADSSCLMATKPICDSKTLPWITANAGRLVDGQLVVAMNDFFDGATADVAIEWSRRRLA
ncbi:PLC-like phosphodiesterase [Hyaloscypha finlandica]|nr:PLC-like phosphodiesterase [Hyaloscypha finlandica]